MDNQPQSGCDVFLIQQMCCLTWNQTCLNHQHTNGELDIKWSLKWKLFKLATCGNVSSNLINNKHEGKPERQSHANIKARWGASFSGRCSFFTSIQARWSVRGGLCKEKMKTRGWNNKAGENTFRQVSLLSAMISMVYDETLMQIWWEQMDGITSHLLSRQLGTEKVELSNSASLNFKQWAHRSTNPPVSPHPLGWWWPVLCRTADPPPGWTQTAGFSVRSKGQNSNTLSCFPIKNLM